MSEAAAGRPGAGIAAQVGDTPAEGVVDPFHLHFTGAFRAWLARIGASIALTTYQGAKLILIGPGLTGGTVVTERRFERCMALAVEGDRGLWVATHHQIWRLENGLEPNRQLDGWDRVYLPRSSHITGGVDVHDLAFRDDGALLGVITGYNCIARIGGVKGSFAPVWRPPFVSAIVGEDRCHLNGFCLEDGRPAYATMVAVSDRADGWRAHRADGGLVMDVRSGRAVAEGLAMPHTPRLHQGTLWMLEAGTGWFGRVDPAAGRFERLLWRPGFLRGLRFFGDCALICSSKPRDRAFSGLPLEDELQRRGAEPRCALDVVDLRSLEVLHSLEITGSVSELYDAAVLEGCRQPLLYGVEGSDIRRYVVLGPDESGGTGRG
jgi:uncharacterized protein (TIGR03032 family)